RARSIRRTSASAREAPAASRPDHGTRAARGRRRRRTRLRCWGIRGRGGGGLEDPLHRVEAPPCRRDSVRAGSARGGHLSRLAVTGALQQPTREHVDGQPFSDASLRAPRYARRAPGVVAPCLALLRTRSPILTGHPASWWALTPPFHPCPRARQAGP